MTNDDEPKAKTMSDMERKMLRTVIEGRGLIPDKGDHDPEEHVRELLAEAREHYDTHDTVGCVAIASRAAALAFVSGLTDDLIQSLFIDGALDENGASIFKSEVLVEVANNARMFCAILMDEEDLDYAQIKVRARIVEESNFLDLAHTHSRQYITLLQEAVKRNPKALDYVEQAAEKMKDIIDQMVANVRTQPWGVPEAMELSAKHIESVWRKSDFTSLVAIYIAEALISVNLGYAGTDVLMAIVRVAEDLSEQVGQLTDGMPEEGDSPQVVREKEIALLRRKGPGAFEPVWVNVTEEDGDSDEEKGKA